MTLGEAREKCEAARKLVREAINPVQNRQLEGIKREHDASNTFEIVAKEWLALKDWEDVTKKRRLGMLERVVFPSIGKLPVSQITPAHILGILNKTVKSGAPTVAAEAKRTISGCSSVRLPPYRPIPTRVARSQGVASQQDPTQASPQRGKNRPAAKRI